jgi:cbb3-type cytochrome oxidase subunit 1
VVWVVFAINFFWTLAKRREKHLYVAIWFYIATIVTVAVLHIVNNLALPVTGSGSRATRSSAACRTRWCSGGTATTPSPSS